MTGWFLAGAAGSAPVPRVCVDPDDLPFSSGTGRGRGLYVEEHPGTAPQATNPFHADASVVPVGRSLFNQHCSHCHAPNAINPDPSRDLRRLKVRYRENMAHVFYETVTEGRPTKGMVPWKGVLSEDAIWKIFTFLESVQREP